MAKCIEVSIYSDYIVLHNWNHFSFILCMSELLDFENTLQIPSMYSAAPGAFSTFFCVRSTVKRISHALAQTHKGKRGASTELRYAAKCFTEEMSPVVPVLLAGYLSESAVMLFIPTLRQMETGQGSNE